MTVSAALVTTTRAAGASETTSEARWAGEEVMAVNRTNKENKVNEATTCGVASEVTVEFVHEKSTKNTERYKEEVVSPGGTPLVGTLYLQKQVAAALGDPRSLVVTIRRGA